MGGTRRHYVDKREVPHVLSHMQKPERERENLNGEQWSQTQSLGTVDNERLDLIRTRMCMYVNITLNLINLCN